MLLTVIEAGGDTDTILLHLPDSRVRDRKCAYIRLFVMVRDSANVSNCLTMLWECGIEMKCERCNSHCCTIPGRHFSPGARQSPVSAGIEVAHCLQSARTHAREPPNSKPLNKTICDVLRRNAAALDQ